jgi:hypothetical protein
MANNLSLEMQIKEMKEAHDALAEKVNSMMKSKTLNSNPITMVFHGTTDFASFNKSNAEDAPANGGGAVFIMTDDGTQFNVFYLTQ